MQAITAFSRHSFLLRLLLLLLAMMPLAAMAQSAGSRGTGSHSAAEASMVSKQALDYYKNGEFQLAAELYRRAFRIDPTKPEYLFGLARSLQNGKQFKEAVVAYESLIALLPATDPWSRKGRQALSELQATMGALDRTAAEKKEPIKETPPVETPKPVEIQKPVEVVKPVETPKPVEVVKPVEAPKPLEVGKPMEVITSPKIQQSDWKTPTEWTLLGVGAAGIVTGIVLVAVARSDRADLDKRLAQTSSGGLISGTGYSQAKSDADSIAARETGGVIALSVGVVSAGIGAWLLLSGNESSAWIPSASTNGICWAGKF